MKTFYIRFHILQHMNIHVFFFTLSAVNKVVMQVNVLY